MLDLATRAEIEKLSIELGLAEEQLSFLQDADAADVASLRQTIAAARFARLEPRLRRLAGTVNLLPLALTARIAKATVGPALSGRVASVLPAGDAIRFAQHYDAAYIAKVCPTLQPEASRLIIDTVPAELAVEVATHLLADAEFPTLGRLVCAAPASVVDGVIARADPTQLLMLAYFTDDHERLDDILRGQDDGVLLDVVRAALPEHGLEMLSVMTFVRPPTRARLLAAAEDAGLTGDYREAARAARARFPSTKKTQLPN